MHPETTVQRNSLALTREDIAQITAIGITAQQLEEQVEKLKKGAAPARVHGAALIDKGILGFPDEEKDRLINYFSSHAPLLDIIKFVPASGAATRMFKTLLALYNSGETLSIPTTREKAGRGDKNHCFLLEFMEGIRSRSYAFWNDLNERMSRDGLDLAALPENGDFRPALQYLLTAKGLDYANLPKALLKFHRYTDHSRTSLEEHLAEGLAYSKGKNDTVRIHLTISPQYRDAVNRCLDSVLHKYEKDGVTYSIELSEQHASTDTIAVDIDNQPLRDNDGRLAFRPGGHGALIENLDELDGDIIFIKNIDNVVPDRLKNETTAYKKLLGGCLMEIKETVSQFLRRLNDGTAGTGLEELTEIAAYARQYLNIDFGKDILNEPQEEIRRLLSEKLDRPIRVCGMVKNQGEPGGGPFWVKEKDGTVSLQIVEGAQIDHDSPHAMEILKSATHFNPVDLVCSVKDYKGNKFDLMKFVDPEAYFISSKSMNGKSLKALELPGLWNGAMANWITLFVEVPIITFNPTKTINDLLRKEHL